MTHNVLYLFRIENDFSLGYAWSAELSRRLKTSLSLFTTLNGSFGSADQLYVALAKAECFYRENFGLHRDDHAVIKSKRHFFSGTFETNLIDFLNSHKTDIIVLEAGLLSPARLKKLVDSGNKIIVLSNTEKAKADDEAKGREQFFIDILQHAEMYNVPVSVFKTLSLDTGLFNYISSLFKK